MPEEVMKDVKRNQLTLEYKASEYLQALKQAKTSQDSLSLAEDFGFTLPIKDGERSFIKPLEVVTYFTE